jgi:molybdopterin converting factor subunit 1
MPPRTIHAMQVQILFFGLLKDLAGRGSDTLDLPDGATVQDVISHYGKIPRWKEFMPTVALSVNQEYASPEIKLKAGDEVAFLPPVSGGAPRAFLTREKIDAEGAVQAIQRPEDGATVVFEGIVRNNSHGRRTLYLDYEAYEGMAVAQLESLAGQAMDRYRVREVMIIHRLGRLEIGDTSVLIAVVSAHRGPAFDACRWLIDTLKRTVPIWKKEYFEDGAVWADGEDFPTEIPRAQGTHSERPASK